MGWKCLLDCSVRAQADGASFTALHGYCAPVALAAEFYECAHFHQPIRNDGRRNCVREQNFTASRKRNA
jgi:hypothetical protein